MRGLLKIFGLFLEGIYHTNFIFFRYYNNRMVCGNDNFKKFLN